MPQVFPRQQTEVTEISVNVIKLTWLSQVPNLTILMENDWTVIEAVSIEYFYHGVDDFDRTTV